MWLGTVLRAFYMCVHAQSCLFVRLFETPWTVARQSLVCGILQARVLEWVAIFSSKGSFQARDQT